MSELLIVYGTKEGQTARIARTMARLAKDRGVATDLLDGRNAPQDPNLGAYRAVIVAASVHAGHHEGYIERFVHAHACELGSMPSAFVSVSLSASKAETRRDVEPVVDKLLRQAGWAPGMRAYFGGALAYRQYNMVLRWIMKRISARAAGPTDTSKNYDLTDWTAVEQFTEAFLKLIKPPTNSQAMSEASIAGVP